MLSSTPAVQTAMPRVAGQLPRVDACVVCDALVPAGAPRLAVPFAMGTRERTAVVCGKHACRSRVNALPVVTPCLVCRRPGSTAWERVHGVCESGACLAIVRGREACKPADARRTALVEAATAWRDRVAHESAASPDELPLVIVPSVGTDTFPMRITPAAAPPMVRLPRRRVRAFRAHLRKTATAAAAAVSGSGMAGGLAVGSTGDAARAPLPVIDADEGSLLGAACAACGGRCCRQGADAAYLTPATLQRWMVERPGTRAADAVRAYAAHLPAASIRGSCVYHTTTGCALPRDFRSDTCNRFLCDGLHAFRQLYAERTAAAQPVRRMFIAVNEDGRIARGQLSDAVLDGPVPLSLRTPAVH